MLDDSQIAVVVEGLADLLRDRLVYLHNGRLVPAAVAVVRRAEDSTHSLNEGGDKRGRRG